MKSCDCLSDVMKQQAFVAGGKRHLHRAAVQEHGVANRLRHVGSRGKPPAVHAGFISRQNLRICQKGISLALPLTHRSGALTCD